MRRALSILRHSSPRNFPPASSSAFAATQSSARSFAATASGLDGITVTKGSASVQQAVAQQRWVVGDADSFKKCDPCEQGGKPLGRDTALALLQQTPLWKLSDDGTSISRTWVAKDFKSGCSFLQHVAVLAENEGHHPDLHLTSYNNVTVRLTTYALGGLSYNDFIIALKIDSFPKSFGP